MDVEPVFNEYKAVTYMCSYFSKSEGQCSQSLKETVKESFANNMHHYETMITMLQAYLSIYEYFI